MGFSRDDQDKIFLLAERLIGTCQEGSFRKEILVSNVKKRLNHTGYRSLSKYIEFALENSIEKSHLISALTIHTTSWFREAPHWDKMRSFILEKLNKNNFYEFKIWTSACSTGEEAYSIALMLESIKEKFINMNYVIYASDIDSQSIDIGQKGIYSVDGLEFISAEFKKYLKIGHGPAKGFFAVDKLIRQKCHFFPHNLLNTSTEVPSSQFDIILCRNVLIYFDPDKVVTLVDLLSQKLSKDGLLILGHSEALARPPSFLDPKGGACYSRNYHQKNLSVINFDKNIKNALVVDDSMTIRTLLKKILEKEGYNVTTCEDTQKASDYVIKEKFDLITLDLNVPGENGVQWLSRQRKEGLKTPVVIISESSPSEAEKIFGALEIGAQEYIVKSDLHRDYDRVAELFRYLGANKIKSVSTPSLSNNLSQILSKNQWMDFENPEIIMIGASTGGPEVVNRLLMNFPQPCPPIIVIQHIVTEFSSAFARRISKQSGLQLGSIGESSPLKSGCIYIPEGDFHFELKRGSQGLYLEESVENKLHGHRPSIDFLFKSVSRLKIKSISILLTGMGKDGADGLLMLKQTGLSYTMVQDESTSVVYGMPKVAQELGASLFQGSPESIRNEIIRIIHKRAA